MLELLAWDAATDSQIQPERPPVNGEWARHPNGVRKQYVAPADKPAGIPEIPITLLDITGRVIKKSDLSLVTIAINEDVKVSFSLPVPDRTFNMPVALRTGDKPIVAVFRAKVRDGVGSVTLNFNSMGLYRYTEVEANIDVQGVKFVLTPVSIDVVSFIDDDDLT